MRQRLSARLIVTMVGKVLLFAGWLAPLWLSIHFMLQAWRIDEAATLKQNSFPYVAAAGDAITISFVWLAVAIAVRVVIKND